MYLTYLQNTSDMAPATTSIILLLLFYGGNVSSQSNPVQTSNYGLKPGRCPVLFLPEVCIGSVVSPLCSGDKECPGNQKCCNRSCGIVMCTIPVPRVKPGKCPSISFLGDCLAVLPPPQCSADNDCPGDRKCCKDSCGAVNCIKPIAKEKPGRCPRDIPPACGFPPAPPDCYSDEWCLGEKKCCYYICKRRCLKPIITKG
ncbi:antileukoproteinase-like [Bufo bufo]|uniref:antileukoproteinase-like n=1 Tax=Bufo bufo TaxID=8384 RepID=UPI001ABE1FDD|nr:antileukoproteinase-like [Bufo bufo]